MICENDAKNYEAFLKGDMKSFELIVVNYRDHLVSFIYQYIKDIHLAQDLAQDVFVEILLHKERYDSSKSLKTYLFCIARNKTVDYIRRNKKYLFVDELVPSEETIAGLEDAVIVEEEKKVLYRMISQLKIEYQTAITLIDIEDLSYAQAAKVMGKTLGQTKILIHRARKALAKLLDKEGDSIERLG